MGKRFMQLAAAFLAMCLLVMPVCTANAADSDRIMIRVGLASSSDHVPTGELESANLENNNSAGYGQGFRFGRYDRDLNFLELARTDRSVIAVSVLKAQNLYYNGKKYSSDGSGVLVGSYHIRVPGSFSSYDEAAAAAAGCSGGFVAWIDGQYQVRAGSYASKAEAEASLAQVDGGEVVGTSTYGMTVVATGTNQILFQYDEGASGKLAVLPDVTGAAEVRTWFEGFKYRGGFQYHRRSGGNLTVVNVVPLEDYVNGVICYEMGREWPLEALKAQAMCARTYVLKSLGKHESYGFDICNSSNCQVYRGMGNGNASYGPSQVSMQAVRDTEGLVVKYNGKLAETPYSSSFGGASEDAANVWGTNTKTEHPYLRGVEDPYEADLNDRNDYSPWTKTFTSAQLTQRLQSYGYGVGSSIDHLELRYSDLGNVIRLTVHWTNGQTSTFTPGGANSIRSRFDLRSIRFTVKGQTAGGGNVSSGDISINGSGTVDSVDGMYAISDSGTVSQIGGEPHVISGGGSVSAFGGQSAEGEQTSGTAIVSGSTYVFEGGGWGHQLGMSQFGANAMARRGFTYNDIITFYLPGVQIMKY